MNPAEAIFDFPDLTAAQIAWVLSKDPRYIRQKRLRGIDPTNFKRVEGNRTAYWNWAALPVKLRTEIIHRAHKIGFDTVGKMIRAEIEPYKPKDKAGKIILISEIRDDHIEEAEKLRKALLPALTCRFAISQQEVENEAAARYKEIFGKPISGRRIRYFISRTVERDGSLGSFARTELYLRKFPARKPSKDDAPPVSDFPLLLQAIQMTENIKRPEVDRVVEVSREQIIWERFFETFAKLRASHTRESALRKLRDFVFLHDPGFAGTRENLSRYSNRLLNKWEKGEPLDKRSVSNGADIGETRKLITPLPWFIPAARFIYAKSNRGKKKGSVPEALRWVMSLPKLPTGWPEQLRAEFLKAIGQAELPTCPMGLRQMILARRDAGQPLVPESIAKQIRVNDSTMQFIRSPRDWALENQTAPGSQRRHTNRKTYEREIMQPGDWFGGDDATPGIAVCVPCKEVITPVSQKFGVLLGRFQWLAYHDARTDKLLAWDYVVRPRGSYRAEDILNGMAAVVKTHGIPRQGFQFEGGAWKSKLVQQAIQLLGCEHWRTYSPHQKSIEAVFNKVWTRLAVQFPHADMGRYRNENEANCKLYEACKAGHQDPRQFFPTLEIVTKVFEEETAFHNSHLIVSEQYGRWVPDEFFQDSVLASPLRNLDGCGDWIFSPFAAERAVKGMMVSCRVPMFENFSVPFDFGADWLPQYHGQKVRLHFNPRQPKCTAKVVLLATGEVLGDAQLVGETAQHIRFILDWGDDDQRAGYLQRQRVGNFIRRETRGIGAAGRVEYSKSEARDGLERVGIVEKRPSTAESEETPAARRLAQNFAASETIEDRRATLAELTRATEHLFA